MEVKILCPCGAKYKFDVEPLHGKLPGPVTCPVCSADGTELGNQVLAQTLPAAPPSQSGAIRISAAPAAAPVQASGSGFVAPALPRSSKEAQGATVVASAGNVLAAPVAAPVAIAPPPSAPAGVAPKAGAPRLSVQAVHASSSASASEAPIEAPPAPPARRSEVRPTAEPSFLRGLVGIGAASFLGLLIWFAIALLLGPKFKWAAIGIGALIGWTGHWLAKEKSQRLGFAAAAATALVMLLGVIWSARHEAFTAVNETIDEMWKEEMAYAKEAVAASVSDEKLRAFLSKNGWDEAEEAGNVEDLGGANSRVMAQATQEVDAKELADFRKNELPRLRNIAGGKMSRSQFDREHRAELEEVFTFGFIIASAFRIKMLVLIGLAVGAAWKFTAE